MEVSQHMGHPQIINFARIFHDKPSISAWNQRRPIRRRVVFSGTLDRAGALRQDHRWSRGPLGRWAAGPLGIRDHPLIHFGPSSFCHFLGSNFYGYPGSPDFFFHLKKSAIAI